MGIYKSSTLPQDGKVIILDPEKIPQGGRFEILEEKLQQARTRLIKLEFEIQEAESRAQELKKDILVDVKKEVAGKIKEAEDIKKKTEIEAESIKAQAEEEANRIKQEANTILEDATGEVQKIISEAVTRTREQADDIRKRAHETSVPVGKQEGYDAGYKMAKEKFQGLLSQIEMVLTEAKREKERISQKAQEEMSEEIIDLAIIIAKKIIKIEIAVNRDIIVANIKESLSKIQSQGEITVRVNLVDLNHVESERDELLSFASGLKEIHFYDDPSIEPGGCKIETTLGIIDATITTQMERLEEELRGLRVKSEK
ncbi:MAG: FliH/SctL family protein [bacterium]|nr:FliH/SctL family protein [bacterium]